VKGKECVMKTYLKNIKYIASLMAFIAALLVGMTFATVSNAVVVPDNPVIGNPADVNAAVSLVGVKSVDSKVRPGFNRPNFFNNRPNFFNNKPNFIRPFGFGFNRPFFGADFEDFGAFREDFD
jgi:hypothetical protein